MMTKILFIGKELLFIIFMCAYLISCNYSNESESQKGNNLPALYDKEDTIIRNLKFNVYCIHAGMKFSFKSDTLNEIDYTQCDLKIDTVYNSFDTLLLGIHFFYKKKLVNFTDITENGNLIYSRLLYDKKQKRVSAYITNDNIGMSTNNTKSRLYFPMQPDVVIFLKRNKNKLNSWLKNESARRGVLD